MNTCRLRTAIGQTSSMTWAQAAGHKVRKVAKQSSALAKGVGRNFRSLIRAWLQGLLRREKWLSLAHGRGAPAGACTCIAGLHPKGGGSGLSAEKEGDCCLQSRQVGRRWAKSTEAGGGWPWPHLREMWLRLRVSRCLATGLLDDERR